jgi:hypothetical protein
MDSRFLNFICACVPGVGYMYNGLQRKGFEALILFICVTSVFDFFGIGLLSAVIGFPLWFYCFFDTFNVYRRRMSGEYIEDTGFIYQLTGRDYFNRENVDPNMRSVATMNSRGAKFVGVVLIVVGAIILSQRILDFEIWRTVRMYIVPVLFIFGGAYILLKDVRR